MNEEFDPTIVKVIKAIKHVETGGIKDPYNAIGDGGRGVGAFQWDSGGSKMNRGDVPKNWMRDAHETLGDSNAPMTKENQNKVAYMKVKSWKDQGRDPEEIAALWNGAKKNGSTGRYEYVNPQYGEKFRNALTDNSSQINNSPITQQSQLEVKEQPNVYGINPQIIQNSTSEESQKNNIVQDIIKPIFTRPLARIGQAVGTVGRQIGNSLGLVSDKNVADYQYQISKPTKIPLLGTVEPQRAFGDSGGKQILGNAMESGSMLAYGGAGGVASNIAAGTALGYIGEVGNRISENPDKPVDYTPGLGTLLGGAIPAARPLGKGLVSVAKATLGKATGAGSQVLQEAFDAAFAGGERQKKFLNNLRGNADIGSIVDEGRVGLDNIMKERSSNYINEVKPLLKQEYNASTMINNIANKSADILDKYKVKIDPNGELNFKSSVFQLNPNEMSKIKNAWNGVQDLLANPERHTLEELDTLKQALYVDDIANTPAKKLVDDLRKAVRSSFEEVPGYTKGMKNYSELSDSIENIQKALSLRDSASIETAYKKLTQTFRQNNELRKEVLKELEKQGGVDLSSAVAGEQLSPTLPRGLSGYGLVGAGTLGAISIPHLLSVGLLTSPRVVGELMNVLGVGARGVSKAAKFIPEVKMPGQALKESIKNRFGNKAGEKQSSSTIKGIIGATGLGATLAGTKKSEAAGYDNTVKNKLSENKVVKSKSEEYRDMGRSDTKSFNNAYEKFSKIYPDAKEIDKDIMKAVYNKESSAGTNQSKADPNEGSRWLMGITKKTVKDFIDSKDKEDVKAKELFKDKPLTTEDAFLNSMILLNSKISLQNDGKYTRQSIRNGYKSYNGVPDEVKREENTKKFEGILKAIKAVSNDKVKK